MPVRVSVVVATFNSGHELDRTVDSVRRQTIGLDAIELILVDDGSTDGRTPERVRQLGKEPWITALAIPNSGWPSRPRNTGLDAARGDYVLFMDHDDLLYPKAVERMLAAADADGADMVLGKEVRSGARTMGLESFRTNLSHAHVVDDHVIDMLTPHKMFRTEFLLQHGLRFAEHLRRLEDHHLLAAVFVHDPNVSVVADYPCYRWVIHDTNNSIRLPEPGDYFGALREVLDLVDRWPYGERVRQDAYRLWERVTVLNRLGANGLRTWPTPYQHEFLEACTTVLAERFDPALDAGLSAVDRARAALVRAGSLEAVLRHVDAEATVTTRSHVIDATAVDGSIALRLRVGLEGSHGPRGFQRTGGRVLMTPSAPDAEGAAGHRLDVTDDIALAGVELLLTHRSTNAEWFQPSAMTRGLVDTNGGLVWAAEGRATITPATALLGHPITPGVWDVKTRTTAFGYDSRVPVRVTDEQVPPALLAGGVVVTPYVTQGGRLALKVEKAARTPPARRPHSATRRLFSRLRNAPG
jgi:glycosyltransferase involved in cell wall biosynthesis